MVELSRTMRRLQYEKLVGAEVEDEGANASSTSSTSSPTSSFSPPASSSSQEGEGEKKVDIDKLTEQAEAFYLHRDSGTEVLEGVTADNVSIQVYLMTMNYRVSTVSLSFLLPPSSFLPTCTVAPLPSTSAHRTARDYRRSGDAGCFPCASIRLLGRRLAGEVGRCRQVIDMESFQYIPYPCPYSLSSKPYPLFSILYSLSSIPYPLFPILYFLSSSVNLFLINCT